MKVMNQQESGQYYYDSPLLQKVTRKISVGVCQSSFSSDGSSMTCLLRPLRPSGMGPLTLVGTPRLTYFCSFTPDITSELIPVGEVSLSAAQLGLGCLKESTPGRTEALQTRRTQCVYGAGE